MTQFPTRTVLIALGAAALTACTTYEPFETGPVEQARPNYPVRAPEAPPTPPPASADARPTTPIPSAPLPPAAPPPSRGPAYVTPSTPPDPSAATGPRPPAPPPPPPPAYQPLPAPLPPPAPATRTVTRKAVTGKVVDAEGPPRRYTVEKGDNLDAIGRKMGLSRKELADLNGLKSPYALKPGQVLKGPASKARAYVVGSGDTLFAIARRFNVSAAALADENDIRQSASLRVGQKLRLPEGYKDKGPITVTTQVEVPATPPPPPSTPSYTPSPAPRPPAAAPAAATPYTPPPRPTPPPPAATPVPRPVQPGPAPAVRGAPSATPTPSDAVISQLGRGRFAWPLRGEVISAFGPKGVGQINDGINIRANPGDTVRAAAGGDVVYAGDQVPGFGNLVLVKHADGWVTAYGHLARVDVKMQQKVTQGQQLGQAGSTGGVGETQLHFEVRYAPAPTERARPINPALVLPD